MTPAEKISFAALARKRFCAFPKFASNNSIPQHLYYTANRVQATIERKAEKNKMLLIAMPPRHGKTELISKHLPAWVLGKYPDKHIILTSYSSDLSDHNSDVAKGIFEKHAPVLWNTHKSKTMFNRSHWETSGKGGLISAGVGGSITGFGADLFIIDDYVKGSEEAESKNQRDKLWRWWESVAATRLHPNSTVIVMATRWHDDDLIGRLKKQKKKDGDEFPFELEVIDLPAIAEDKDDLSRKKGEALWPSRYNLKLLLNIMKTVGSYVWNALFQCTPTARGGSLFKSANFRYYERDHKTGDFFCYRKDEEKPIRIVDRSLTKRCYVDPAIEIKKINDPSGMAAWAYNAKEKIWLLLEARSERIEHTKIQGEINDFAMRNGCTQVGIENEKLGKVLVKQSFGTGNIPCKEVPTKGLDKYARATPMATAIENERVFFPRSAPWLADYEDQLVKFPNADHDEFVDTTAYASEMETKLSVSEMLANRGRG